MHRHGARRIPAEDVPPVIKHSQPTERPAKEVPKDPVFGSYSLETVYSNKSYHQTCVTWLCDGSALVTGATDGAILVLPLGSKGSSWASPSSNSAVDLIVAHPRNKDHIAAAFRESKKDPKKSTESSLRLYDTRIKSNRGDGLSKIRVASDLLTIRYSSQGDQLLAAQRNGSLSVYDVRKISSRSTKSPAVLVEKQLPWDLNDACYSPDGSVILAAFGDENGGGIRILKADTLATVAEHLSHSAPGISIAQTPPAAPHHLLALGGNDAVVTLWAARSMAVLRSVLDLEQPARHVSFGPAGRFLAYSASSAADPSCDAVDIAVVDHSDLYSPYHTHRMVTGPMFLTGLEWSPKQPILGLCGEMSEFGSTRPSNQSSVCIYTTSGAGK